MSEYSDLYQELILDHQKNPRNFGELSGANRHAEGFNPLCGDKVSLDLKINNVGVIEDVKFKGSGCAISKASASMMTVAVKGKKIGEAQDLFQKFHGLITGEAGRKGAPGGVDAGADLGKLKVFAGVKEYPARVKCASLAWHTLQAALGNETNTVTTDDGMTP